MARVHKNYKLRVQRKNGEILDTVETETADPVEASKLARAKQEELGTHGRNGIVVPFR